MDATSEASGPLLTGSPLASRGREARTISIFLGASFSAGGSWVIVGGFMASGATPWLALFFFFCDPRLLDLLRGFVKRSWNVSLTVLAYFCHLEGSISP